MSPTRVGAAGTHHPLHSHCCAYTGSPTRPAAMVTGAYREAHPHQCSVSFSQEAPEVIRLRWGE